MFRSLERCSLYATCGCSEAEDLRVMCLGCLEKQDESLALVALDPGVWYTRASPGSPWVGEPDEVHVA
jgi:hypothetical protein